MQGTKLPDFEKGMVIFMKSQGFERLIMERINLNFHKILPMAALVSFLSAVAVYFSDIPKLFAYLDFAISILMFLFYMLKNLLPPKLKIITTMMIPIVLGIFTFMDGGFSSGTLTLFLISNAIAVTIFGRREIIVVGLITIASLLFLWRWSLLHEFQSNPDMTAIKWIVHILLVFLFVFIFYISVNSIKVYLVEKIEELEESVKLTHKLAYYDNLTDLPNYYYFMDYLSNLGTETGKNGLILILSLKNINMINAVYGNDEGNYLLSDIGNHLKAILRSDEKAARVSGNEFVLWIQEKQGMEEVYIRKNEIISLLFHEKRTQQKHLLEYYAATAEATEKSGSYLDCYRRAQIALTYAKYVKKESMVHYDQDFDERIKRFTALKELLKKDVADKENFMVYYQPQVSTKTGLIEGVEALARWQTLIYGMISPGEFIPIIDNLHLHESFGLYILELAVQDYSKLELAYGNGIKLSVNISPSFLMCDDFEQQIVSILAQNNFPEEMLTLEITEEMIIEGVDMVNHKLEPLKKRGIKISLDDFGTGFSSLNYLAKLQVDELKLDKALIDQLMQNEKSRILIKTIIGLAKQYDLKLVAEGVEEEQQYEKLKEMECHLIQGYYCGRPKPLNDVQYQD